MGKDYSKMFDTPEDILKERKALQMHYRRTIQAVEVQLVAGGGMKGNTNPRNFKYKRLVVQGIRTK